MTETIYEKTLGEFRDRLVSKTLDKLDEARIANFIERYPSKKWTREQVIEDCIKNEKLCAKMAKDAMKQNLDEVETIKKIGGEKLPPNGKKNIRFRISDGKLVEGHSADFEHTKSADFYIDYKGIRIYGSQKTIHGSGGAQTNQIKEAVTFVESGNKSHKAIAVIDGLEKPMGKMGIYTSDEVLDKKNTGEDLI